MVRDGPEKYASWRMRAFTAPNYLVFDLGEKAPDGKEPAA